MAPEKPGVLEWHRTSASASIVRPLAIGAGLLSLGPVIAMVCFALGRTRHTLEMVGIIGGGICTILGPVYAVIGLIRSFRDDAFLAARTSGVTFERSGKSITMPWEDIEVIVFDSNAIHFRLRKGDPFVLHEKWADIETEHLAKNLEDLRRKASFNLLKR